MQEGSTSAPPVPPAPHITFTTYDPDEDTLPPAVPPVAPVSPVRPVHPPIARSHIRAYLQNCRPSSAACPASSVEATLKELEADRELLQDQIDMAHLRITNGRLCPGQLRKVNEQLTGLIESATWMDEWMEQLRQQLVLPFSRDCSLCLQRMVHSLPQHLSQVAATERSRS